MVNYIEVLEKPEWKINKISELNFGDVFISSTDISSDGSFDMDKIYMKIDMGKNNVVSVVTGKIRSMGPGHEVYLFDSKVFVTPRRIE